MLTAEDSRYLDFAIGDAVGVCLNFDETPTRLAIGGYFGRFLDFRVLILGDPYCAIRTSALMRTEIWLIG